MEASKRRGVSQRRKENEIREWWGKSHRTIKGTVSSMHYSKVVEKKEIPKTKVKDSGGGGKWTIKKKRTKNIEESVSWV